MSGANRGAQRPSPNLLDTIHLCQRRQDWYVEYARDEGLPGLGFVGSATLGTGAEEAAAGMREAMGYGVVEQRSCRDWEAAHRLLIQAAERAGVLVMVSGVIKNTHRRLDPGEFRGFALPDPHAPLVFVNGSDTKAAITFTLAHELAHIWLGEAALSDTHAAYGRRMPAVERWCDAVAAEFLAPRCEVAGARNPGKPLPEDIKGLARSFKVSTLVALRRLRDTGQVTEPEFREAWDGEVERLANFTRGRSGSFHHTKICSVSRRFVRAVVTSTLEGDTLHTEAFRLLGVNDSKKLRRMGREAGVPC